MSKIGNYFKQKNIDVSFDTLGGNDTLISLFVQETQDIVKNSHGKISNQVKHACYSKYYKIEERTKFTGFEKFKKLDTELRNKMSKHVTGMLGIAENEVKPIENLSGSYLTELKNSFKNFKNPLLYLSGGIDSEFVALAMIDAKIKFTPVIFEWINDSGKVFNLHDIYYALDFCNTHDLYPIVRKINLEKLWTNPEFVLLAKDTNISSSQINTYVYMVETMAEEFKDSTHVLGGEVRFKTVADEENNKLANFVLSAKEPTGNLAYHNQTYVNSLVASSWSSTLTINLIYNYTGSTNSNQTWQVTGTNSLFTFSGIYSGDWFIADLPGGTGFEYSTNGGTSWTDMATGANTIATLSLPVGTTADNQTTVNIQVRNKSIPQITISSTITIRNEFDYVPSLRTITTNDSYVVPPGVSSIEVLMVGGGGGGSAASNSGVPVGAGGGGGQVRYQTYTVAYGQTLSITIGAGGTGGLFSSYTLSGGGTNGGATTISGGTSGTITAQGGFATNEDDLNPGRWVDGGNAGNGIYTGSLGDSIYSTARGGGGAGNSQNGGSIGVYSGSGTGQGGAGGNGTQFVIGGTPITLGGGGGGATNTGSGLFGAGGTGGGASAIYQTSNGGNAPSGGANTGGGGAGAFAGVYGGQQNNGGAGGAGVVYIYG